MKPWVWLLALACYGSPAWGDMARPGAVSSLRPCTPVAEAVAAQFHGFSDIPDHNVLVIRDSVGAFLETPFTDPDLTASEGELQIVLNTVDGSLSGYTYLIAGYGEQIHLFPAGKYHAVGFDSNLLCADWDALTPTAVFPNNGPPSYVWHGDSLNVQPEDRNVVFQFTDPTLGTWTLICNEELHSVGVVEVNGIRLIGPAGQYVKLSHWRVSCP